MHSIPSCCLLPTSIPPRHQVTLCQKSCLSLATSPHPCNHALHACFPNPQHYLLLQQATPYQKPIICFPSALPYLLPQTRRRPPCPDRLPSSALLCSALLKATPRDLIREKKPDDSFFVCSRLTTITWRRVKTRPKTSAKQAEKERKGRSCGKAERQGGRVDDFRHVFCLLQSRH